MTRSAPALVALLALVVGGCGKPQPETKSSTYQPGQQVGVVDEFVQGATGATAVGAYQHTRGQISDIKRQREQQGQ